MALRDLCALLLAALAAWLFCPLPPRLLFSPEKLLWTIVWYLPLPALVALLFSRLLAWRSSVNRPMIASAFWFAPIALLSRTAPEWTTIPLALFTVQFLSARLAEGPRSFRPTAISTALSLQALVITLAIDRLPWAAFFTILAASLATWGFTPVVRLRKPSIAAFAILVFTLIPMSSYLIRPAASQSGHGSSFRAAPKPTAQTQTTSATKLHPADVHRGIILWPPKPKEVKLVAPRSVVPRKSAFVPNLAVLRIPFNGVYWFFQPPFSRPPQSSITEHGLPTDKFFRSTGGLPLIMEAHQHLGVPMQFSCCHAIQVELRNADPFATETLLELVLWDTTLLSKPRQSLGLVPVQSTPAGGLATSETLTFPLPAQPRIRHFDAISVRFHRPQFRHTRSSRIAIQAFILIP